jgi:high-affinity iron transporter
MLANYLIGLREGLEAALVVSILIAYLVKSERRELIRFVWFGVAAAVSLSLAVGAALTFGTRGMPDEVEEAFAGLMSILAVALVTWMIFWMARRARFLKGELQSQLDRAADAGVWALVLMAFVAVAREGLETALFIWSAVQANGGGPAPFSGAALGLATSVGLGWLIYRGALRLNLRTFFTWTGAGLVVVAAGVLSYGVHDLQEAGLLPGANRMAFDVSAAIPESSWYGTLLKGVFNFSAETTWLQLVVWLAYLIPTMTLFLWTVRGGKPTVAAKPHEPITATGSVR